MTAPAPAPTHPPTALQAALARAARTAAGGGAWLLFGERTRAHDALYDGDLQAWLASGALTRLDRAFSRDGGEHRYVQSLVAEHARPMADWVDRGAYVYVCGDATRMAVDVHEALICIVGEQAAECSHVAAPGSSEEGSGTSCDSPCSTEG